jgi:hypothetical protein
MQISSPDGKWKKELRRSKRHSVYLIARLVGADGTDLVTCQVADISRTGAHLKTDEAASLPDHFLLFLAANGAVRRRCLVVWRSKKDIGVEFVAEDPRHGRRPLLA